MPIKVSLPDKQTKAMMTKAGGGEIVPPSFSGDVPMSQQFPASTTANTPLTKVAQFAGSGANVIFTQPMFFSPLHTPQNWQIASKRRESAQWMYLPYSQIVMSDYTFKNIEDLDFLAGDKACVDPVTGGTLYANIDGERILSSCAKFRKPKHFGVRDCEKKRSFEFFGYGLWRPLAITEEHKALVIDGKLYRHKRKIDQNAAHRRKKGIPKGGDKPPIKFPDKLMCWKEAKDIAKEDFLVTPVPEVGKLTLDSNKAWMLGLCVADGCLSKAIHNYRAMFTMNKNEYHIPEVEKWLETSWDGKVKGFQHGDGDGWRVGQSGKDTWKFFDSYITGKHTKKKFDAKVFELDKESRLHVLGGYFDGDGCFSTDSGLLTATNYSVDMVDQIYWLLVSVGIAPALIRAPLYGEHYKTDSKWCYKLSIPSSEVPKLEPYMRSDKLPPGFESKTRRHLRFFYEEEGMSYLAQPIRKVREFEYTGKGYDVQVDPERAFVASGFVASNCRFWYSNESKVAAGVDFYSYFPLAGFKLECRSKKIVKYFERVSERLNLEDWLAYISHEYYLLGDVFPFLEIACETCGGGGVTKDGEECDHKDGTFSRIVLMNPDYVEVQTNVLASEPVIALMPDEELRMLVQRREPKQIYDRLPPKLIDLVASGRPIPLSNRSVSHIRHNASSYATYGTPLLQRMFTILAYKTKIMTANWITAERLILPVRIVKVGDKDRPASEDDISNVQSQLSAVANDPNLTIITHHAFEYCHDEETEVLTDDGWKYHWDVDSDDKIAVFDKETGESYFDYPVKKHIFDYDGELIHFNGKRLDICVTPNHRMLYSWDKQQWLETTADKVRKASRFRSIPDNFQQEEIMYPAIESDGEIFIDIENEMIPVDAFMSMAGYYISEGCAPKNKFVVYQSSNSVHFAGIKNSFDDFGYKYSVRCYREPDSYEFCIYRKTISEFFIKHFGSHAKNKTIPSWVRTLPKDKLKILLDSMNNGDGHDRSGQYTESFLYTSASKQLIDDLQDVSFRMGRASRSYCEKNRSGFSDGPIYRLHFSVGHLANGVYPIVRKHNIHKKYYKGKVWCFETKTGFFVTRRNGLVTIQGNSWEGATSKIHNITSELENIGKEVLDGFMINQALLNGEAAGYSSSQVGVEVLLKRLERWQAKLAKWVEKHIFLPIAMMHGFIDEEESKEVGETVYLYPKVKWNDLKLRDKSNMLQLFMQLYDKQLVSGQTICEEFELDYDIEQEKLREEQLVAMQTGQIMPGAGGAEGAMGGGGMPMGGAGGAPPGAEVAMGPEGGMPGAEMGGVPGGAPGGAPGMGGMGGMGGMPAAASAEEAAGLRIPKRGKGREQEEAGPVPTKIMRLTKLEQKMYKVLSNLDVPFALFGQYAIRLPGQQQPFSLDFAYPEIGVGIETDGKMWHERDDLKERDMQRDQKLANVGWRILRFKEEAVEEHMDAIRDVIYQNILEAAKDLKKAAEDDNEFQKFASLTRFPASLDEEIIGMSVSDLGNGLGKKILIGESENNGHV